MRPPIAPAPVSAPGPTPGPTPGPAPVRRPPAESGIALLLVLLLSLILLPFTVQFTMQVELESRTSANVTDQLKIENEIDGQYEILLQRLAFDAGEEDTDSASDAWNEDELRNRTSKITGVSLTTHIWDEQGKFNIRMLAEGPPERRAAAKDRLVRILLEFRRDTDFELSLSDAETWRDQIAAYVTRGSIRANIPTPKTIDNRSILILEELNFLPEVRERRFEFLLQDQPQESKEELAPGLHRLLTVFGTGKLNLNTCEEVVLRAFFPKQPDLAERIIERRDAAPTAEEGEEVTFSDEETASSNPYQDVNEINEVEGVSPPVLADNGVDPGLDFDVRSSFFAFRIIGETQTTRRDELFVVERVPGESEEEAVQGFRLLVRQERTDPLDAGDTEDE